MNLSLVRERFAEYFETLQDRDGRYGAYRGKPGLRTDLYSSLDVAIARTVMGEDFASSLSADRREEWTSHINSFARKDGTYEDTHGHSRLHGNRMVIGALGPLGGGQPYRVHLYDEFATAERVGRWLETVDWVHQWGGSHLFLGGIHCFSMSRRATDDWLRAVFEWLDRNLDETTGWWRKGCAHADRHQPLGGSVHILPIYEHHHRRFPYPERVIDSVLALQLPGGIWLDRPTSHPMTYLDLDALYALRYMRDLAPDYRSDDIMAAVRAFADAADGFWGNIERRLIDLDHPHIMLSIVGTFGLLNQLLPDRYRDEVRWTDIFSDIRLYQTAAVEVAE